MALTPLRRKLNIAFGLLLLGVFVPVLWPLVSRPVELWALCGDLQPGGTLEAVRSLAGERGFKVSPEVHGSAHIYDLQSLGRFSCALRLNGGRLLRASFAVAR